MGPLAPFKGELWNFENCYAMWRSQSFSILTQKMTPIKHQLFENLTWWSLECFWYFISKNKEIQLYEHCQNHRHHHCHQHGHCQLLNVHLPSPKTHHWPTGLVLFPFEDCTSAVRKTVGEPNIAAWTTKTTKKENHNKNKNNNNKKTKTAIKTKNIKTTMKATITKNNNKQKTTT